MVERGQHLRLALEAGEALRIVGEGLRQDLDGDLALQPRVAGAVDLAIPPAPSIAVISYGPSRIPAVSDMWGETGPDYIRGGEVFRIATPGAADGGRNCVPRSAEERFSSEFARARPSLQPRREGRWYD